MIEIQNLTVSFGGVSALRDVSITLIEPIVGVIGPNGAGKTTLLNVFSGFVQSETGRILAHGADLLRMKPHLRTRWGLRRAFQTEQVVEDLSAADNIRTGLDSLPFSRAEKDAEIRRALDFVGLAGQANVMGASLNSFERRMVEIAKAVSGRPKVILLDEPAGGLSQHETEALKRVILGIHGVCGAMTLLIDHDVELIATTCVETMVLDFGTLIASGPTAAVLRDERVKAAYLGIDESEAEAA